MLEQKNGSCQQRCQGVQGRRRNSSQLVPQSLDPSRAKGIGSGITHELTIMSSCPELVRTCVVACHVMSARSMLKEAFNDIPL